ncbi:aminoglycoside phosphotransferase family protein [Candidatus Poribacteria bacterium]|jgi:hypothetical protein|nr:aminoglycoside phosphotransferase family protein [Candidatus Poribacteria bacterium]MBT5531779.1 aminoglycoside phosphotransferase family protein [Candidatus Poribacteria bacterium]MBT5714688.1 aminoglycoside phosphotransferase family protein [Candidatus Poribacteria bacterium]MBT7101718.1 aminoglycoside phosphotransferase family protein [Candidatus Poribacteria bacterium]MBT7804511.1 aminoglycoside phosphotransferase family protein [Candidatus Poribacteria bacterium]
MSRRVEPPWDGPVWRDGVEAWTRSELAARGRTVAGEIEEVRTWSLSCVLRAPTSDGWVYFKEALNLPLFAHEPRVTQRLAKLFPGRTPEVLAIHPSRRWMLTSDAGEIIGWETPEMEWATPYAQCAHTQRAATEHVADLLAAGCRDRDIGCLPEQFDAVLEDAETMGLLPDATADALASLGPRLVKACERLGYLGMPNTLVHGDLHVGNMAVRGGHCVTIDWTDVCISHPFMDGLIPHRMTHAPAKERTRLAILDVWEGAVSPRRLHEAWELSAFVCPAHHMVSYGSIMAHMPLAMREELADDFGRVAQQLVDAGAAQG